MQILVVEDEKHLALALTHILEEERYLVDTVYNGNDGYAYAQDDQYDLIILDIMLPGLNGFEVVRRLRQEHISTPILLLTARTEVSDKVNGLDCGADDYMTKPFSTEELLARVRALGRRQGDVVVEEQRFADLVLNLSNCSLSCGDKDIQLSYKEFEVLRLLMTNSRMIVPKKSILLKVWGADSDAEDNNVEAYISFLRKKFTYLDAHVVIKTIRKVGYRLEEDKSE